MKRIILAIAIACPSGAVLGSPEIPNWPAPSFWSPPRNAGIRTLSLQTDISTPLPFIPVIPCRQYDSRNATALADNTPRTVNVSGPPCGVPSSGVGAISANITVFSITGATGNGVFKTGIASPPTTAWINYPPAETQRANAGVLATDQLSNIVVQVNQGGGSIHFVIDINGYYATTPATATNGFSVFNSAHMAIAGRTDATGLYDSGVYGAATNTVGVTNGVFGDNVSTSDGSAGVFGLSETTIGATVGVWGRSESSSDGAIGTYGEATGFAGVSYGVKGVTNGTADGAAGVKGVGGGDAGFCGFAPSGVCGSSVTGYGVEASSKTIAGRFDLLTAGGSTQTESLIGFNPYAFYAAAGDFGGTGAKYFIEPHPAEPTKVIRYVSLEGPESGTYFRGESAFSHGQATIEVPESFRIVTDEEGLSVQITPIGDFASFAVVRADLNRIVVKASRDVRFYYMINGVRRAFKDHQPIIDGREFMPETAAVRMPVGLPEETKRRLVANGTYNVDGTVNMRTAERVGWTKVWAEREAERKAAAKETLSNARK